MRVLRENKDSVMAVLEAFVYDPLLNWRLIDGKRRVGGGGRGRGGGGREGEGRGGREEGEKGDEGWGERPCMEITVVNQPVVSPLHSSLPPQKHPQRGR